MSVISEEVTRIGLPEPLFHVFSETVEPCPSETTGAFDEFPAWPVTADQVTAWFRVGATLFSRHVLRTF